MIHGRVKCYFHAKGYGFIEDFDGREVYFHFTSVEGAGPNDIAIGAGVAFDVITTELGLEAFCVKMLTAQSA